MLARDPICRWELAEGRYCLAPATEADHVQPVRLFPELRYDLSNAQGLCKQHHNSKTALERRGVIVNTREGQGVSDSAVGASAHRK